MAAYLALQILKEKLSYEKVMSRYSKYKAEIDLILSEQNKEVI